MMCPTATEFASSRANGKTNQQVVLELVKDADPGSVFGYQTIAAALEVGVDREFTRREVQAVVNRANRRLLPEQKRLLRVVKNVGYVIAFARDHVEIANIRNRRSNRQLKWAVSTLEHARLDEMSEQERAIHTAQQIVNTDLLHQNLRILHRQESQARLIASLTSRVDQMEGKKAG